MSSNRWLIAAGLALLLLIGASIAVGLRGPSATEFPAGSPEGTVQAFIRAVEEQDANALRALLSPGAQQRCELGDIRNALRYPEERDLRVTLRDTRVTTDRAEIRVRVTENTGAGPFDSGSYDHEETFDLVRFNDQWLIEQPTWPIYCPPRPVTDAPTATPPLTPTPSPKSTPSVPPKSTPTATAAP
jgi:hypothetical protein